MKKSLVFVLALCLVCGLMGQAFSNGGSASSDGPAITIAPQTFILGYEQAGHVVVHSNIDYDEVDTASLYLEGVAPLSTKADSRGELVAYFDEDAIEALTAPPRATLTLVGDFLDGTSFEASDTVRVRQSR